jgi:hypothetical protein
MTLIISLLFATAFVMSIGAIMLTINNAMPRISAVIGQEFAPAIHAGRRINFGEVKRHRSAEVIAFPRAARSEDILRLAA